MNLRQRYKLSKTKTDKDLGFKSYKLGYDVKCKINKFIKNEFL